MTTVLALSVFALDVLRATPERLASIGTYETDPSVNYREDESRLVLRSRQRLTRVAGSGLGATILDRRPGHGRSYQGAALRRERLPVAGLEARPTGRCAAARTDRCLAILCRPRTRDPLERAVIVGAQAALFALAVATVAFPSFNQLAITPAIGLLVALAVAASPGRERRA